MRDHLEIWPGGRSTDIFLPIETWVRIVYRYADAFHSTPRQRIKVLDTMIPLYYARVASLVNELKDKDTAGGRGSFSRNRPRPLSDMKRLSDRALAK